MEVAWLTESRTMSDKPPRKIQVPLDAERTAKVRRVVERDEGYALCGAGPRKPPRLRLEIDDEGQYRLYFSDVSRAIVKHSDLEDVEDAWGVEFFVGYDEESESLVFRVSHFEG